MEVSRYSRETHVLWEQNSLDTKLHKDIIRKKNYRSISLRNIEAKIVNTINQQTKFNNILEQYIKKYNIHIIKGNIFQEHKDGSVPTNQLM